MPSRLYENGGRNVSTQNELSTPTSETRVYGKYPSINTHLLVFNLNCDMNGSSWLCVFLGGLVVIWSPPLPSKCAASPDFIAQESPIFKIVKNLTSAGKQVLEGPIFPSPVLFIHAGLLGRREGGFNADDTTQIKCNLEREEAGSETLGWWDNCVCCMKSRSSVNPAVGGEERSPSDRRTLPFFLVF